MLGRNLKPDSRANGRGVLGTPTEQQLHASARAYAEHKRAEVAADVARRAAERAAYLARHLAAKAAEKAA